MERIPGGWEGGGGDNPERSSRRGVSWGSLDQLGWPPRVWLLCSQVSPSPQTLTLRDVSITWFGLFFIVKSELLAECSALFIFTFRRPVPRRAHPASLKGKPYKRRSIKEISFGGGVGAALFLRRWIHPGIHLLKLIPFPRIFCVWAHFTDGVYLPGE